MDSCNITFTRAENDLAYRLYEALLKEGVACEEMDVGYSVINYAGMYCSDKEAKNCMRGKNDGRIEAEEVFAFALNNYEKYQKLIEGTLGRGLPWVLDDLDPSTKFDADIRRRVNDTIAELKKILKENGEKEGTDEYNEKLIVGLFYFVAMPDATVIRSKLKKFYVRTKELDKLGLQKFQKYLEKKGGLRALGIDPTGEYTALNAIKNNQGKCTEISKVLFAVFKTAGFKPDFVFVDTSKEKPTDPVTGEVPYMPPGSLHVCICLYLNGKIRLFDPALFDSDASHRVFYPLTLRQYLCLDYSNHGVVWTRKGNWGKAIENFTEALKLDSNCALAYYNFGLTWSDKRNFDKAIAYYMEAIRLNPNLTIAYFSLAFCWHEKGDLDKTITNLNMALKLDPDLAIAYNLRGAAWSRKGNFDEALADYSESIRLDPNYIVPYNNRAQIWIYKGDFDKAIADYTEVIRINPNDASAYNNRGGSWIRKNDYDKTISDFTSAIKIDPSDALPYNNRGIAWAMKGNFDMAIVDFATALSLNPSDRLYFEVLLKTLRQKWQSSDELKTISAKFKSDSGGAEIAAYEAHFILAAAYWKAGKYIDARKLLKTITDSLNFEGNLAPSTVDFFQETLKSLPDKMREDKEVKVMMEGIEARLK